jgi:hypothetical protein
MSGTGTLGAKRKTFRSTDLKNNSGVAQKKAKTVGGGKKGVDYITITHKNDREDFSVGDCILVQSERKNMPFVRWLLLRIRGNTECLTLFFVCIRRKIAII